ncbi:MFS transporter [Streptomyces flaveolus]|uniref:MDR family MFS transporter n=1 Tax=Streptomyces flaveolus TaxID=67297 RepID=UPI0033ADD45E
MRPPLIWPKTYSMRSTPRSDLRAGKPAPAGPRSLSRSYWILWAGTLVNRLGTMVQPFLALYLTGARGLTVSEAGLIMSSYGLGAVLSPVPAGWLADRVGRRAMLTGGTLCTAAAMTALGFSTRPVQLAASVFALGLAMDAYRPAAHALVADLVPRRSRGRAYGLLLWAVNLGSACGFLIGGMLVRDHFSAALWIDALTCVVFGLLVWYGIPDVTGADVPSRRTRNARRDIGLVLRDRVMIGYGVVTLGYCLVYLQSVFTLPLAMRDAGLSPRSFSLVMAVNAGLIVLLQPWAAARLGEWDRSSTVACGIALTGAGFAATAAAGSTAGFALGCVVWTAGEILVSTVSVTLVADLAPAHLRGAYNGVYGFVWALATLLAPLFGSRLLDVGEDALWFACGAVAVGAAVGQLRLGSVIRARST